MISRPRPNFDRILFQARECRTRAKIAVNRERDAAEVQDPLLTADDPEALRLQLMGKDRSGNLHRARTLALQAAKLTRTPGERYRAAELLLLIEHELDHKAQELQQARRLVELRPRSQLALSLLRRAAMENGRWALVRQVDATLAALPEAQQRPARRPGEGSTSPWRSRETPRSWAAGHHQPAFLLEFHGHQHTRTEGGNVPLAG